MYRFLIVVDMQNDFIDGPLGTPEAVAIVPKVKEKILSRRYNRILTTLDVHMDSLNKTIEYQRVPKHCVFSSSGEQINPIINQALTQQSINLEDMFYKSTFSSFRMGEFLKDFVSCVKLEKENLDVEIEIVGLCTDICVISTALMLRSMLPEVEITIDSSCCAGTTPEKHRAALEVAKSCLINVKNFF